jgi:hypothetical protein
VQSEAGAQLSACQLQAGPSGASQVASVLQSVLYKSEGFCGEGFWPQARRRGARIPAAGFECRANQGCGQKNRRPMGFRAKDPLASLRLSHSPAWGCSFVAPRHRFLCAKTEPLGFLKHTLERRTARAIACPVTTPKQSLFFRCVRVFSPAESAL